MVAKGGQETKTYVVWGNQKRDTDWKENQPNNQKCEDNR